MSMRIPVVGGQRASLYLKRLTPQSVPRFRVQDVGFRVSGGGVFGSPPCRLFRILGRGPVPHDSRDSPTNPHETSLEEPLDAEGPALLSRVLWPAHPLICGVLRVEVEIFSI